MKTFILFHLSSILVFAHISDKYFEALQYLDGTKGGKVEEKTLPRCPYEKCQDSKTYKFIKKNKKQGYKILKEISRESELATNKALSILLKQIDYKSKKHDSYLVKKLLKDYGLTTQQYNSDVLEFANIGLTALNKKFACKSAYILKTTYKHGYFNEKVNIKKYQNMKKLVDKYCEENSYYRLKQ